MIKNINIDTIVIKNTNFTMEIKSDEKHVNTVNTYRKHVNISSINVWINGVDAWICHLECFC